MGQKRTGKTSTMNGVARSLIKLEEFIVSKTSYGRFAHSELSVMIYQLVNALAKEFIKNGSLTITVPETNGSLAPIVEFLEDIHHFWQSLRAISQMEFAGFLLVGGENIQLLKTAWGQDININTTYYSGITILILER